MRRGEKKEQGEDSGKQRAASPETKEEEKRKRREKERERERETEKEEEDGWTELRLLGMNSRRGLSGREIDFHGWGLAVRTL